MTKYQNINGVNFEVVKSKYTDSMIKNHKNALRLSDFYETYSYRKRIIEEEWREWASGAPNVCGIGVQSANTFSFTMGAWYIDTITLEIIGYIQITPCHERLYLYN